MPYIKPEDREKFASLVAQFEATVISSPGELNYLLTMLTHRFLNMRQESYQGYNDAIGALEGCKLELYRRHVGSYENDKIKQNGDV
jgi:hypothetical protein